MPNTQDIQTGFAEVNGTTLYYEVAGAGHPFVLVHGHLLDRRSWDEQFAVFAQRYRVMRYDQRGFGDSGQAAPGVRERVREMTTRNWERPDDEAQAETPPVPLEPPAIGRLSQIRVPALIILGEWDAPNPLDQLATDVPGAKKVIMAETAHHPFMEKPAEFNQVVLDFLGALQS